jgi:DNA-binding transcriptional regulator YdaS (Cro superfamily)
LFGIVAVSILGFPKILAKLLAVMPTLLPKQKKVKKYRQAALGLKPNKISLLSATMILRLHSLIK